MEKIIEISNTDWLKGISLYPNVQIGGFFQALNNVDPFETGGLATPSYTPANGTLANTPLGLTNYNDLTSGYILAHTPQNLYQVLKDSPYTVTDKSSFIATTGTYIGSMLYRSNYVYARENSSIRAVLLPGFTGDTQVVAGFNADLEYTPLVEGANGNGFYGDNSRIGTFIPAAGTMAGATTDTFDIDTGFTARDLLNDGRYLVIVADNNNIKLSQRITGHYSCKIYFWDMVTTDARDRIVPDIVWEIKDSYVIGAKILDGTIYVFSYNGIYICNSATPPKLLLPFPLYGLPTGTRPLHSGQIAISKGSIFWVDGEETTLQGVFGLGNPVSGQQKIFYVPFQYSGAYTAKCLTFANNKPILGTSQPGLFFFRVTTTRGTMSIQTTNLDMSSTYTYGYTKVVLKQPLSSGQSVTVTAFSQNGSTTLSQETKSYSSSNPKQVLIFRRTPGSGYKEKFTDISITVSVVGASVARVETYATKQPETNEEL